MPWSLAVMNIALHAKFNHIHYSGMKIGLEQVVYWHDNSTCMPIYI